MTGTRHALVLIAVALAAAALIAAGAFLGVPDSADEFAYRYQAETFLAGRLTNPPLEPAAAFEQAHLVQTEQARFSKYPPGWPLVLVLGQAVGAAALVNPLLLALILWLGFTQVRRAWGGPTALTFLALLASNPFFFLNATGYFPHLWVTLCLAGMVLAGIRYLGRPSAGAAGVLGCALGLVLIARPQDLLFLAPSLLLLALWSGLAQALLRRPAHLAAIGLPVFALGALFLVYNARTTGDPWLFGHLLLKGSDRPSLDPAAWAVRTGHRLVEYGILSTVSLAALPGFIRLPATQRWAPVWFLAATAFCLAYGTYSIPDPPPRFGPRYWLPAQPVFILLAAYGLMRVLRPGRRAPVVALLVLLQGAQIAAITQATVFDRRQADGLIRAASELQNHLHHAPWIVVRSPAGAVPLHDLMRTSPTPDGPRFVRGDRALPPLEGPGYVWEGPGGLPALRAMDPEAAPGLLLLTDPPRVLGAPDTSGWLVVEGSNRATKWARPYPGSRPQDWLPYHLAGPASLATTDLPGNIPTGRERWRVAHYRTWLEVPVAGRYTFSLAADDAAQLWVDGVEVLRAATGLRRPPLQVQLDLDAGTHALLVAHANTAPPERLRWSARDPNGTEVPATRYRAWRLP